MSEKLKVHPFATMFPVLEPVDLNEIADRISRYGLREPGILFQGMILDGRHRAQACEIVGVPMKWKKFDGTEQEAFEWVIDQNFSRRQMNPRQRIDAVASMENVRKSRGWQERPKNQGSQVCHVAQAPSELSAEEHAKLAKVSPRTIKRNRKVQHDGSAKLNKLVVDGSVSINTAAKLSELPKSKQNAVLAQGPAAVQSAARDYSGAYNSEPARRQVVAPLTPQPGLAAGSTMTAGANGEALAALETTLKEDVRAKQWVEYFSAKIEACYDRNKGHWNNPPPPTPRLIVDSILKAVRS